MILGSAIFSTGCATPQTSALLANATALPSHSEISAVPYYPQESYQCGPATLAMAMGAAGKTMAPQELEAQVYLPGRDGSLQVEMLATARRNGFIAYPLAPKLDALLAEIAAGHPAIVLENLAFNWYPMWHYAVAIGYDLDRGEIMLRSGSEQRQLLPLTTFEHTWSRSNYWAMLVLPPDQLPHDADEDRYIAAAMALEHSGPVAAAHVAYHTATQRWPGNLTAQMGLGNTAYALGDMLGAAQAFRAAIHDHPTAAVAFNNLADTLAHLQRYAEALLAAEEAVRLGGDQQAIFEQTLAEIKGRQRQ